MVDKEEQNWCDHRFTDGDGNPVDVNIETVVINTAIIDPEDDDWFDERACDAEGNPIDSNGNFIS